MRWFFVILYKFSTSTDIYCEQLCSWISNTYHLVKVIDRKIIEFYLNNNNRTGKQQGNITLVFIYNNKLLDIVPIKCTSNMYMF